MARILAAMSGGVDSSVAAALLVEEGHEVVGAYMKNWINEENILGDCPWQQDIVDARAVADRLGIEFRVVNLMRDYRERVVHYLLSGYEEGITPNPDVMCNREMKFGVFLDYALGEGFEAVATGHYARITRHADGSADILRGADPNKDQSYFLALLRQEQIRRARFPIGGMPKPEVREKARELGLSTAEKKDSQGICFIGQVRMRDFLSAFVPDRPGDIVTVDGEKVGRHRGLHLYTLGQRRGIGVASPVYREPFVVVAKRPETNELVLGFDNPDTPGLYARRCTIGEVSFTRRAFAFGDRILAQPRYRTAAVPAAVSAAPQEEGAGGGRSLAAGGRMLLTFDESQRALTPGQVCAFYEGEVLLGGGIFEEIFHDAPASGCGATTGRAGIGLE